MKYKILIATLLLLSSLFGEYFPADMSGAVGAWELSEYNQTFGANVLVNNFINGTYTTFANGTPTGFDVTGNGSTTHRAASAVEISLVNGYEYLITFDLVKNGVTTLPNIQFWNNANRNANYSGAGTTTEGRNAITLTANTTVTGCLGFYNTSTTADYEITNLTVKQADVGITDLSGNGNVATSANAPTFVADHNGVPGQAQAFVDADGDYLTLDNEISFADGEEWTISMTFESNLGVGTQNIYTGTSGKASFITATRLAVYPNNGYDANVDFNGTVSISANVWTNITLVCDGTTIYGYQDGALFDSGNPSVTTMSFSMISDNSASGFDGSIFSARIYSEAKSATWVSSQYTAGLVTANMVIDAENLIPPASSNFDTDGTAWWTLAHATGFTWNAGTLDATFVADGTAGANFIRRSSILTNGCKYFVSFKAKSSNQTSTPTIFNGSSYEPFSQGALSTDYKEYSGEFVLDYSHIIITCGISLDAGKDCTFDDITVTDITSKVTDPLAGAEFYMPMHEDWTQAGANLVISTLENSGSYPFDTFANATTSGFDAISTGATYKACGTDQEIDLVIDEQILVSFDLVLNSGSAPDVTFSSDFGSGVRSDIFGSANGHNKHTFVATATANNVRLSFYKSVVTNFEVTNLTIKKLNAVTTDLSVNQNHGTVSGATLQRDGLVNVSDGVAYIPSTTAYGSWMWNANNHDTSKFIFISSDTNEITGCFITLYSDGRLRFYIDDDLRISQSAGYIDADTDYRIWVTRTLAGVFTIYIKGGSYGWDSWTTVGTYTDASSYTISSYIIVDFDAGDTISGLKINGQPISLSDANISSGTWTTTKPSYEFDGVDDYIEITNASQPDLTGDLTFSCWIYPESYGEGGSGGRVVDNGNFLIFLRSSTNDLGFASDGSSFKYSANNSIDTDTWQHILITRPSAGTNINFYINGVLSGTVNQDSGTPARGTTNIFIGNRSANDRTFDGCITEPHEWSRILSTDEISYDYNRMKGVYK